MQLGYLPDVKAIAFEGNNVAASILKRLSVRCIVPSYVEEEDSLVEDLRYRRFSL